MALAEFAPSYRRATAMQAPLALIGGAAGLAEGLLAPGAGAARSIAAGGALLSVMPFTLLAIHPTNRRLLDPSLGERPEEAMRLLSRWGRLHAARTALGAVAFVLFSASALP